MPAYLDHAATTPMRPEAVEAMLPFLTEHFGNPSGAHALARRARRALDEARDAVAGCLGARPDEVVFTGGGTEADNLALAGVVAKRGGRVPAAGREAAGGVGRVVCTAVEHHAVLHATQALGGEVAPVLPDGTVDLDALADLLGEDTAVVSVMLANNEVGTVQPLADVVALVRERAPRAVVHTDAVQAPTWLDVAALTAEADLVALSAHKFGGPKGVGVLVARRGVALEPLLHGGGQERGRRSGTPDVAGVVATATALRTAVEERAATVARVRALRDRLADGLLAAVPGAAETGHRATKLVNNCHLTFGDGGNGTSAGGGEGTSAGGGEGIESEALLVLLDDAGVCASAGSSCASGAMEPSHVLAAMGVPRRRALSSVRLTLGATSTDADVDLALKALPDAVARLREPA